MAKTFADFQQGVDSRIQDAAAKLAAADRDDCIREALTGRYSQARPRLLIKDLAGDSATYAWTPAAATAWTGWDEQFSAIRSLEYPQGERPPAYLGKDDWCWVQTPTGRQLQLITTTPQTGYTLRVSYTVQHSADASTVPDADFVGAVNLAAAIAARRLQAIYSQLGDSSIGADAVDYRGKQQGYGQLAADLETKFAQAFGLDKTTEQPAASASTDWDPGLESGYERLTH